MGSLRSAASWALPVLVGAVFLAILAVLYAPLPRPSPLVVELHTLFAKDAAIEVPGGRALVLFLDLTGLPVLATYIVEVNDALGVQVSRDSVAAKESKATVQIPSIPAGPYFVHVTNPEGTLLREYGFKVARAR